MIVDRRVVWMKGYGFRGLRTHTAIHPADVMNVGSVTKPFTGVAMMRAVQEGRLSLDQDINEYLPFRVVNPHHPDAPITLVTSRLTRPASRTDRRSIVAVTTTVATPPSRSATSSRTTSNPAAR
jgi:hypothetical protein